MKFTQLLETLSLDVQLHIYLLECWKKTQVIDCRAFTAHQLQFNGKSLGEYNVYAIRHCHTGLTIYLVPGDANAK